MKIFNINLQTTLFLSEHSVLGAYNENKKILVYNKPLVNDDLLEKMIAEVETKGKVVRSTYKTDNFDVNFYDHNTGGTSVFHEVKGKVREGQDPIDYDEMITKELFEEFTNTIKVIDPKVYIEEGKDEFVDLYDFWQGKGYRRFMKKLENTRFRVEEINK